MQIIPETNPHIVSKNKAPIIGIVNDKLKTRQSEIGIALNRQI